MKKLSIIVAVALLLVLAGALPVVAQAPAQTLQVAEWYEPEELTSGVAGRPTVLKDGDTCHMWYGVDTDDKLLHTTSSCEDPTLFDMGDQIDDEDFEGGTPFERTSVTVFKEGDTFYMIAYGADSTEFALYTSSDGDVWVQQGVVFDADAALPNGSFSKIDAPFLFKDGDTYRLYFQVKAFDGSSYSIFTAETTKELSTAPTFTLANGDAPVLTPGGSGAWDDKYVMHPWVVKDGDTYFMWYSAYGSEQIIGLAKSADGYDWVKSPANPILSREDFSAIGEPAVINDNGTWRMWYLGTSSKMYYLQATGPFEYNSIQGAIDDASAGATINVAAGTYPENVTIPAGKDNLSLQGANAGITAGRCEGERVEGSGLQDGYLEVRANNVLIDGMDFAEGGTVLSQNCAVYIGAATQGTIVRNSVFTRSYGYDLYRAIINEVGGGGNLSIEDNSFTGWATGIYLQNVVGATVAGNRMESNNVGMSSDGGDGVTVTGNAFANNAFEGMGIGSGAVGPENFAISHNSFVANATALKNYTGATIDAKYNWWGSQDGPADEGHPNGVGGVDASDWLSPEPTWCPFFVTQDPPMLWVAPAAASTNETGKVEVSVMLDPSDFEVFGFEFTLTYALDVLSLADADIEAGAFFSGMSPLDSDEDGDYKWIVQHEPGKLQVWVTLANPATGIKDTGAEVVKLSFTAAPTGDCAEESDLALSDVIVTQKQDGLRIHPVDIGDPATITAYKLVPVSGAVQLQGRPVNQWGGANVTLTGSDNLKLSYDVTTASSGAWSETVACGTYDVNVVMGGYLRAWKEKIAAPFAANAGKLLGGNADMTEASYDMIFLHDVVAIANVIGKAAEDMSSQNLYPDINDDGTINILDLVLAGINYTEEGPKGF